MVAQDFFRIHRALCEGSIMPGLKPDIVSDEKQDTDARDVEKDFHSPPLCLNLRQSASLTIIIRRTLASGEGFPVLASNCAILGSAHQHNIPPSNSHAYPLPISIFIFFFVFNFWVLIFPPCQ